MSPSNHSADEHERAYQRPNQPWVCGWAAAGHPCSGGPGPGGRCAGRTGCVPHRVGDSWRCARSAASGGPCTDGPLPDGSCSHSIPPCQPVRSLRLKRRVVTFFAVTFAFAITLCNLGGPRTREFLSPGPLTFKHGTVTQTCEACHPGPTRKVIAMLFDGRQEPAKASTQTQLCLECHNMGADSEFPHGMPRDDLVKLTEKVHRSLAGSSMEAGSQATAGSEHRDPPLLMSISRALLGAPVAHNGKVGCAVCHREHHGRKFDLTAIANASCQACHTRQFEGLGNGHPEFAGYPFRSRTAIYFDHESHLGRHFKDFAAIAPGAKAPTSCVDCHVSDATGDRMVLKAFETVCAGCHLDQILDSSLGGIRLLNLPALDTDSLPAGPSGQSTVGEWNQLAAGDPTPFLKLLLGGENTVAPPANLADLTHASPAEREAGARFALRIKELFFDTIVSGDRTLHDRLAKLTDPPLSAEQVTLLAADLPPSTVRFAQERWLPALLQEIPALRAGQLPSAGTDQKRTATQPTSVRWRIHDGDCSIQYLPRRHTDLFLKNWLELSGREYSSKTRPEFAAVFDYLASPYSPGHCTNCHTVEARPDGSRVVNWRTAGPAADIHSFTKFSHTPHISLVGADRCESCHQLDVGSRYSAGFRTRTSGLNVHPEGYESNFLAIGQSNCTACHMPGKASDSCLLCHDYHVGQHHSLRAPVQHFRQHRDE